MALWARNTEVGVWGGARSVRNDGPLKGVRPESGPGCEEKEARPGGAERG